MSSTKSMLGVGAIFVLASCSSSSSSAGGTSSAGQETGSIPVHILVNATGDFAADIKTSFDAAVVDANGMPVANAQATVAVNGGAATSLTGMNGEFGASYTQPITSLDFTFTTPNASRTGIHLVALTPPTVTFTPALAVNQATTVSWTPNNVAGVTGAVGVAQISATGGEVGTPYNSPSTPGVDSGSVTLPASAFPAAGRYVVSVGVATSIASGDFSAGWATGVASDVMLN